jgi:hypothetical protein
VKRNIWNSNLARSIMIIRKLLEGGFNSIVQIDSSMYP